MSRLTLFFLLGFHFGLYAGDKPYLWFEDFPTSHLDTTKWTVISGSPQISGALATASNPYALKLVSRDAIETKYLQLLGYQKIQLSFRYQNRNTESGDDLLVSVFINSSWQDLIQLDGGEPEYYMFRTKEIPIPLTDSLKIQFRTTCNDNFDAWYVDEIKLGTAPEIHFVTEPVSFDFRTRLHQTPQARMILSNSGMYDLQFNLDFSPEPHLKTPSSVKIAVIGSHSLSYEEELNDVVNKLTASGYFHSVAKINAYNYTPSVLELSSYDAVLVCPRSPFYSPTAMGDTLSAYIDHGGGVVSGAYSYSSYIRGKFYSDTYFAITPSGYIVSSDEPLEIGRVLFPAHPIMSNVKQLRLNRGGDYPTGYLTAGAVTIAEWDNGKILAATKIVKGQRRVDLGFYPASSDVDSTYWDAATDAGQLMANSLLWVAQNKFPNWIAFSRNSGMVEPGKSDTITVTIARQGLTLDSLYSGSIHIYSNDWDTPDTSLAVSLVIEQEPYYFEMGKITQNTSGYPGTSIFYQAFLVNMGREKDSYQIKCSRNNWPVRIRLQTVSNIAPGNTGYFLIEHRIPSNAPFWLSDSVMVIALSLSDTSVQDTLHYVTGVLKHISDLPWIETFPTLKLDREKWPVVVGNPEVTSENRYSASYSLRMDYTDAIESSTIRLSGKKDAKLSYYFSPPRADSAKQLLVKAFDGSDWLELARHKATPSVPRSFTLSEIEIPDSLLTNSFRLRFELDSPITSPWYLDDIKIFVPPKLSFTTNPTPFHFTPQQGDSVHGSITVTNDGGMDLIYQVMMIDVLEAQGYQAQQTRLDKIAGTVASMRNRWALLQSQPSAGSSPAKRNANFSGSHTSPLPDEVVQWVVNHQATMPFHIAVLGCEHLRDVGEKLAGTNTFLSISQINARVILPTLKELQAFDAVLAYSGEHYGFYFPDSLGNVLADYVDQGGGVVIGGAVFSNGGNQRISGRFYTEKYYAIVPSGFYCSSTSYDSLGSYQRYHPLMKNVISFKGNYYTWYPFGYPYPDASIIAQWERGYLLVATKEITGVRRVDLGFLLYSSDADPDNGWLAHSDGAQLMANALLWVAQRKGLSEMTTFSTNKDTVLPQQTGTIEFTIDTDQAISNKTYRGYIVITSNTARGIDSLAVSLTVSSIPYYFTVDHDSLTQYGLVGKSVYYGFALHNLGASTDSYELQFKSNQWPVTSWDQNLTHKITNLNNIVAGSTVDFALEVAIPDSIFLGQVDSLWFSITSVNDPRRSRAYPIKTSTEWKERFRSANLDTTKWQKVRGNPYITSFSYHKTSPPYSLGIPGNSAIETKPLNFSRYSGRKISLKYYYQNSGIEKGEDLIIQCYTGSYWMELKRLSGREEAKTQFLPDSIQLSEAYFNAGLKIKFETEFGSGGTWYLDDIEIVDGTQIPKPDQPSCDNDSNQGLVYDLQPNFPNPFNPITQITYSLPEPGHVQIKIYNVLGQLVVSLVDKVQREGKYQIVWDASGCSAGLYFCTIRVNWYSRSNKMLLLK